MGTDLQRPFHRVCALIPGRFAPAVMLPQSPGITPATCIPELVRCAEELGMVAVNLNPAPSGGHWTSPPLTDRSWYPNPIPRLRAVGGAVREGGRGRCG